ncbi:hypothetical protein VPH35_071131 [Triticum aestivum]
MCTGDFRIAFVYDGWRTNSDLACLRVRRSKAPQDRARSLCKPGPGVYLIKVSRMIGHAYLKSSEFNHEPLLAWFHIPRPFHNPILCPEPSIEEHRLFRISVCYICIR